MDNRLPYSIKREICDYVAKTHYLDELDHLKSVSREWYQVVFEFKYSKWKLYENPAVFYKYGHKYVSSISIPKLTEEPQDIFFDTRCPKLTDLWIEADPEFIKSLARFTKLNPTITKLCIQSHATKISKRVLELPILLGILSPIYERLASLKLGTIIYLPSLSFLLEKLPSLKTLDLKYCAFQDIFDIFVLNVHNSQNPPPCKKQKTFYGLTELFFHKWFAPKDRVKRIMNEDNNIEFNADLFLSLKRFSPRILPDDLHDSHIAGHNFDHIPHPCFFGSITYKSVTEILLYSVTPQLVNSIAKSCSKNLDTLKIITLDDIIDQTDVIKIFRTIASSFHKLAFLEIGLWESREEYLDDDETNTYDLAITSEFPFYSEALDYAIKFNNSSRDVRRSVYMMLPNDLPKPNTLLPFGCANTLRKLVFSPPCYDIVSAILIPLAQFTNLEALEMQMLTLDGIELTHYMIKKQYEDEDYKPFQKLACLAVYTDPEDDEPPIYENYSFLIRMFPALQVFAFNIGGEYVHNDVDEEKDVFLVRLMKDFPDLIFDTS